MNYTVSAGKAGKCCCLLALFVVLSQEEGTCCLSPISLCNTLFDYFTVLSRSVVFVCVDRTISDSRRHSFKVIAVFLIQASRCLA